MLTREEQNWLRMQIVRAKGSVPLLPDDPAAWMLTDGNPSTPDPAVYREDCYICRDPEYAAMGLPLCFACFKCGGHVPADDVVCNDCGADQRERADD